jgi:hypothetical protein
MRARGRLRGRLPSNIDRGAKQRLVLLSQGFLVARSEGFEPPTPRFEVCGSVLPDTPATRQNHDNTDLIPDRVRHRPTGARASLVAIW